MKAKNGNGKRHATQQSLNGAIKGVCDVMRRSNCAGATVDPNSEAIARLRAIK